MNSICATNKTKIKAYDNEIKLADDPGVVICCPLVVCIKKFGDPLCGAFAFSTIFCFFNSDSVNYKIVTCNTIMRFCKQQIKYSKFVHKHTVIHSC